MTWWYYYSSSIKQVITADIEKPCSTNIAFSKVNEEINLIYFQHKFAINHLKGR